MAIRKKEVAFDFVSINSVGTCQYMQDIWVPYYLRMPRIWRRLYPPTLLLKFYQTFHGNEFLL